MAGKDSFPQPELLQSETVGAIAEMVQAGYVRHIGLSILDTCRELGIAITAYGVLSRGLTSGHWSPERSVVQSDFRSRSPRFQGDNLTRNLELVARIEHAMPADAALGDRYPAAQMGQLDSER